MKKLGLANTLTLFRIVCIPIFILFFALGEYGVAFVVFIVAGATDLVDGTIARMRKEKSELGAMLDPLADKGLMLTTFVALAIAEVVPWWFVYVILLRDVVVASGFLFVRLKKIKFELRSIFTSKMATLFEMLSGTLAMVYITFPNSKIWVYPVGDIVYGSILVASVLILVATMQYLKLGLELLDKNSKKAKSNA